MVVSRMPVDFDDEDYLEVSNLFYRSSSTKDLDFKITAIERVANPELSRKFEQKKLEYQSRYGHFRIVKVFHGTKKANIPSIVRNNLEVQRHGRNRGHRFGAGVSFSAFASYSSHYCDNLMTDNQMLLCHVLVSNIVEVPEKKRRQPVLQHPPLLEGSTFLRYDTTAKDKRSMSVIVKFENHAYLPVYIIHFTRVAKLASSLPLVDHSISNMPKPLATLPHSQQVIAPSSTLKSITITPKQPPKKLAQANPIVRTPRQRGISSIPKLPAPVPPQRRSFRSVTPSPKPIVVTPPARPQDIWSPPKPIVFTPPARQQDIWSPPKPIVFTPPARLQDIWSPPNLSVPPQRPARLYSVTPLPPTPLPRHADIWSAPIGSNSLQRPVIQSVSPIKTSVVSRIEEHRNNKPSFVDSMNAFFRYLFCGRVRSSN